MFFGCKPLGQRRTISEDGQSPSTLLEMGFLFIHCAVAFEHCGTVEQWSARALRGQATDFDLQQGIGEGL